MAKSISIGPHVFSTQVAALEYYKKILHKYQDGERIIDKQDHESLSALIMHYDSILEAAGEPVKGAAKIDYFERRRNQSIGYTTSGFWLIRKDKTETDFSYISAVKSKVNGRDMDFKQACRHAIAGDIKSAKKKFFIEYGDKLGRVQCEHSGKFITIDEAHLDHAWPKFDDLVKEFRKINGWSRDIPDGVISAPANKQTQAIFTSEVIAKDFRNYHNSQVKMRVISNKSNLQTAKSRQKPNVIRPVFL